MKFILTSILVLFCTFAHAKTEILHPGIFRLSISDGNVGVTATAFLLNFKNKNVIVTNRHVCTEISKTKKARINIGTETPEPLKFVRVANKGDLCLLESTDLVNLMFTALMLSKTPLKNGERVVVAGYPRGQKALTRGYFIEEPESHIEWAYQQRSIGILTTLVDEGSSGSPVFNKKLEVVGVVFGMVTITKEAIFVPLEDLKKFLEGAL